MEALFFDLKSRYGKAEISQIEPESIQVLFPNATEPVIIQKGSEPGRFVVSYPKLIREGKAKREDYVTSRNVLSEGLFWILGKVKKHGKVIPEF